MALQPHSSGVKIQDTMLDHQDKYMMKAQAISAVRTISEPLQLLHIDLFGPTSIKSIDHKYYSLVVTDDFSRVFITNPHNKTPYELLSGKVPNIRHLKPFRCQVTILTTSDHLGKFEGKANDGFLVGYAPHSYKRFKTNPPAGTHDTNILAGPTVHDVSAPIENNLDYVEELALLQRKEYEAHYAAAKHGFEFSDDTAALLHQAAIDTRRNLVHAVADPAGSIVYTGGVPAGSVPAGSVPASGVPAGSVSASSVPAGGVLAGSITFTGGVPASSVPASSVPTGGVLADSIVSAEFSDPAASAYVPAVLTNAPATTSPLPFGHSLGSYEHTKIFPSPSNLGNHQPTAGIFSSSSYDADFWADVTNLASTVAVDPVATKRVNTIHPQSQIIRELYLAKALEDPDWVAAMQKEMQEEGIDYVEVFASVDRIEAIRLFLAFASYMGFMVYQMDVKSAFLYGEIEKEVYVTQPKGFEDPYNPKHAYRVVKALYGLHQEPRACGCKGKVVRRYEGDEDGNEVVYSTTYMYLRRTKLMTPKLDNDRNLRQGARGDVQPKTFKLFRHAYIRVPSSETSESYSPERGAVAKAAVVRMYGGDEDGDEVVW
nr:putative ribonuclease H-like domain-containing protein [Tanacetum cinerariifolium]